MIFNSLIIISVQFCGMNYVHVHKRAFLKQLNFNNNQRIKILEMIYASRKWEVVEESLAWVFPWPTLSKWTQIVTSQMSEDNKHLYHYTILSLNWYSYKPTWTWKLSPTIFCFILQVHRLFILQFSCTTVDVWWFHLQEVRSHIYMYCSLEIVLICMFIYFSINKKICWWILLKSYM